MGDCIYLKNRAGSMNKLNSNNISKWQAPPRRRNGNEGGALKSDMLPAESFERSGNHGLKVGAGLLAAVALLGAAGCTPPPQTTAPEAAVEQVMEADTAAEDLGLTQESDEAVSKKPLTEMELRERELELREREVALKEKELEILQKREAQDAKLTKLQTQREAYEKGKRTGEAVGTILDIFGAVGEEIGGSLR